MSSYLLAKGVGESLNEDSYEVRIIRTAAGSDQTTEFSLAANGFALRYESVEDSALVPGIVHSRCEVTTLWPAAIDNKLDTLLTGLATSEDGDYLLEVLRDSTRIWVGSILVEEFSVDEDSTNKEVRIVATDALSLLKHVDYNDDGTAYSGYQTVYDIVKNIQEKWSLYTYLNEQNSGTEYRLAWAEDVYSEDDYIMAAETHPAGTDLKSIKRSRIHTNPWSSVNSSGATEYISCYDLLQSLCITYQWRLYSYGDAWHLLPVALAGERTPGTVLQWNGTEIDRDVISEYQFQKDAANDVRQKDAAWRVSYTPPHNEVRVTRDTNDGATLISSFNFSAATALADADIVYPGIDTESADVFYEMRGRLKFTQPAQSVSGSPIAELMLRFTIAWGDSQTEYYVNTVADNSGLLTGWASSNGNYDGIPVIAINPDYSASSGYFYVKAPDDSGVYDVEEDIERFVDFVFIVPPPQTAKTGLTVTPDFIVWDAGGANNSTYKAAVTATFVDFKVSKYSGDLLELIADYDIVANTSTGRGALQLGTTHVGQLGASMGRIDVQTSAGVYGTTSNWVCKDNDTARAINTLLVQETLARHNKPKGVERGSIVLRGTSAAVPEPFNFYKDLDTATFYAPVNWQLNATACEVDLTLRKTGRDAISMTTQEQGTGKGPDTTVGGSTGQDPVTALPNTRGYNQQAADIFAQDWSSVIGAGETKEFYYTVLNDGTGRRADHQGESPATGFHITRKIYFRTKGLHESTGSGWLALPIRQPDADDTLEQAIEKLDLYMGIDDDHAAYSFMITYKEETDYLLQEYSGAVAAYSLRKLNVNYTGNCIQVRRTSPSAASQDIGFTAAGVLDTAALATFCGTGDGYVSRWYDQSGNGHYLQQLSTSAQPKIYSNGTLQLNSLSAIQFDGTDDYLESHNNFGVNPNDTELVALGVGSFDVSGGGDVIASSRNSTTGNNVFELLKIGTNAVRMQAWFGTSNTARNSAAVTIGQQYIMAGYAKSGEVAIDLDGTNTTGSAQAADPNNHSQKFVVGARSFNQANPHDGYIQEVVVFSNSAVTIDHEELSDSVNEYYSSY